MATAYTSLLGLALPVTGELSGSWGDTVNDSITSLLDSAISGTTTLSADADVTLTTSDGVANEARQAILLWTAGGSVTRNITAPAQSKAYFVVNKTSSTQSIVIRGAGPTTGVTVLAGTQSLVVWNGVDFVEVASGNVDGPATSTDNAVARFDGTTGKLIQNSVVTIADSTGNMAGVGTLGVGAITTSGALTYGGVTLNNAVTGTGDMVLSTSPTLVTPALGTPSALVGTNITGTAAGLTAGNVTTNANLTGAITSTGNATLLGSFSSANLAGALTDETGTGSAVFANSPTLVTPALGTPASGVVTNLTGTASININGTVGATTATTGAFTTLTSSSDATLHGLTVGRGAGAVSSNTAVGANSLGANTTGSNNAGLGENSLRLNTTGGSNVAVGGFSLFSNTTASNNTGLGIFALYSNTTASNNTAVGYQAGYSNTTGTPVTAFGYQAAYANTTGEWVTAFGYQALTNSTGSTNSAFGRALVTNTSGQANSAFGMNSLYYNTTGSNNTAHGQESLFNNTTASNNTAVGYQAGYSNTTGASITVLGDNAGYSNTTGNYNVYVGGRGAGYNATGSQNTFVGDYAGREATTGSINTFIGQGAGYLITTGAKNTILGGYNGNQGGLDIRTASNYIVLSDGDGNPRGIFDNSGTFLVGTTSLPSASVGGIQFNGTSSGNASSSGASTAAYNHFLFYNGNGIVGSISTSGSLTTYAVSSDYRLKNTIAPMTGALAKVALLKPCTYKWNADGSDGEGFIAHELAEVIPQCVTGQKDAVDAEGKPQYQGIDTSFLVATLTAAIQEQQAIIESLKARLDAANL